VPGEEWNRITDPVMRFTQTRREYSHALEMLSRIYFAQSARSRYLLHASEIPALHRPPHAAIAHNLTLQSAGRSKGPPTSSPKRRTDSSAKSQPARTAGWGAQLMHGIYMQPYDCILSHNAGLAEPRAQIGCLSNMVGFVEDHEIDGSAEFSVRARWTGLSGWCIEQLLGC
jgi:hypothetical protein